MEYRNIRQDNNDIKKIRLKKRLRANDSFHKYKKNQNLIKGQGIENNINNEDLPIQNITPQLTEISYNNNDNNNYLRSYDRNIINNTGQRIQSKYSFIRAYTPKRDFRRKNLYSQLNTKMLNNTTYFKTTDNFTDLEDMESKNKISNISRPTYRHKYRNYSKPSFSRIITEFNHNTERRRKAIDGSNYIRDNIKAKEIITLNNILNKQYNELKKQTEEMKYKISELLGNNQQLRIKNEKLIMNLNNTKQELDNIRNVSFGEIESKNQEIGQLSQELVKIKNILFQKDKIITNLTSKNNKIYKGYNINQNQNQNNGPNEELEKLNQLNKEKDIKIQALLNQINNLKIENQNTRLEKQKSEEILNQKLSQEKNKNQELINNYQKEQEKYKNNNSFIEQNQKNIVNNLQKQYEQNLKELNEKIFKLQKENTKLNEFKDKQENQILSLIQDNNGLKERINDLNNYLKQSTRDMKLNESTQNEMNRNIRDNEQQLKDQIINQQNIIYSLQQEKDQLLSKIKNNSNNNINSQSDQEVQKKIISLKQENEELKKKLMSSLNSETINNNKLNQIFKEKNDLMNQNSKLRNELKELENENRNNILKISKQSELLKELASLKKENDSNFEQLQIKQEENQKLCIIVKDKEREIQLLKNQISQNMENKNMEEYRDYELDQVNIEMNNELEEKKNYIEKLEKEINSIKKINEKTSKENLELKEKLQLMQSGKDEGFVITLDNLKDELKDKEEKIKILIEENSKLINKRPSKPFSNNINNNNNINEEEKEIDLNNKYENNPFRVTMNSQGLTDGDKIKLYRERIKQCEFINESDKIQIQTLKEDIKNMKAKIKELETFGGQIKDMNEFVFLLNQILINYKPKKKEQKDALNKIVNIMNNFQGVSP